MPPAAPIPQPLPPVPGSFDAVDSIALLKVRTAKIDGERVSTLGFTTAGDGGGGEWYWNAASTATPDDGFVVQRTGVATGRYLRLVGARIDVCWFGAVGDNATDSTAAIQTAINAAAAAGGGVVGFPVGTFLVSGSTLSCATNVTLQGQGMDATKLHAVSGTVLKITDASLAGVRDLTVVNDSSSGIGLAMHATAGHSTYRTQIERVRFVVTSTGKGVRLTVGESDGIHYFPTFRDCHIEGGQIGAGTGFEAVSGSDVADHVFVGLRWLGGRVAFLLTGFDLNGGDFVIDAVSIDGCMQTPGSGPSTARSGRGIVVRSCNVSCVQNVRFEENDRNVETIAPGAGNGFGCRLLDLIGPQDLAAGKLFDAGTRTTVWGSAGADVKSGTGNTAWRVINSFERMIAFAPDNVTLANGVNVQVGSSGSGNVGLVKITGPTAAFTIASLRTNTIPDGAQLYLYNTTAFQLTLDHEHTADGTIAAERIKTAGGTSIVMDGPSIEQLVYDTAISRWVHVGRSLPHSYVPGAAGRIPVSAGSASLTDSTALTSVAGETKAEATSTQILTAKSTSLSSGRAITRAFADTAQGYIEAYGSTTGGTHSWGPALANLVRFVGVGAANTIFGTDAGDAIFGAGGTELMRLVAATGVVSIAATRKLGVGTTLPTVALDVGGDNSSAKRGVANEWWVRGDGTSTVRGKARYINNTFDLISDNSADFSITTYDGATEVQRVFIESTTGDVNIGPSTSDSGMKLRVQGRLGSDKGADVSSAGNLTLGADGNSFVITGTTAINAITTAGWTAGAIVVLLFASTSAVNHNTAGGGGTAPILLAGAEAFGPSANAALVLLYNGTAWQEIARATPKAALSGSQFDLTDTNTGAVAFLVQNTNASAACQAIFHALAASGDPALLLTTSGVLDFVIGLDRSDASKLKFCASGVVGTSTQMTLQTSTGELDVGTETATGQKFYVAGRAGSARGANVASGGTTTLGADGNAFPITGTTTINYITTTNWAAGASVVLEFSTSVTLTHNAGSVPGGTAALKFVSGADFAAVSGDRLRLHYDGTNWCQVR
jgi:hypothetical protein